MPIAAELNNQLRDDLQNLGLSPLPSKVNDRKGDPVNVSGYVWRYNTEHTHRSFNWALLGRMHPFIEYALKRYSTYCIETKSELEAYNQINEVAFCLRRSPSWEDLWQAEDTEALENGFKIVIGEIIQHLRDRKRIYRFHRLREFYRFCTDFMPELGFDPEFMIRLDMVFVGGNPKGEAVRREDEEEGPLSREEVEAVRQGLDSAADRKRQDREENAAVALCLAFGRNPANLVLLREQDLKNVLEEHPELPPQLILSIPRIKKRGQIRKRHLFRDEYLEPELAKYLFQLIDGNKEIDTGGLPRPIFMRSKPSRPANRLPDRGIRVPSGFILYKSPPRQIRDQAQYRFPQDKQAAQTYPKTAQVHFRMRNGSAGGVAAGAGEDARPLRRSECPSIFRSQKRHRRSFGQGGKRKDRLAA